MGGMGMGGTDMDGMMVGMLVCGSLALALSIITVLAIVWFIRRDSADRPFGPASSEPDRILKRRYAAGEIDEDEFLRRQAGISA